MQKKVSNNPSIASTKHSAPWQSRLEPYYDFIKDCRETRPPKPYRVIAELLNEKYNVEISHSAICQFVNVRARKALAKLPPK